MSGYSRYLKNKEVCCTTGPPGQRGDRGPTGVYGPLGPTGATGAAGFSGIITQYVYKDEGFNANLQNTVATTNQTNITPSYLCTSSAGEYTESITPVSVESRIKVQFKVKYQAINNTALRLGVVYTTNLDNTFTLLGQETLSKTNDSSGVFKGTHILNFIHWPKTTDTITYTLFFQLESSPPSSSIYLGVVGDADEKGANYILLEEYLNKNTQFYLDSYGVTGPTGSVENGSGGGGNGGSGIYANDTWMLDNLFGQPPPIQFGTPVSKSNTIYIPWSYPNQKRSGWISNQWLPSITNFNASITPGTGATGTVSIPTDTTNKWINDNLNTTPYVTLLAIQKTSITPTFGNVTYTDASGASYTAYAYQYYDATLVANLGNKATANKISAYYSNPSTFNTDPSYNSAYQTFYGFVTSGPPSVPRSVTRQSGTSSSMNIAWLAPTNADTNNPGEGTISSYNISYNTTGSTIRYNGPVGQTGTTGALSGSSTTTTLSGLYPDASYSIAILATNNSDLTGPYSTPIVGYTNNVTEPAQLSAISLVTAGVSYSTSATIYAVGNSVSISPKPLMKGNSISTTSFTAPIHRTANRGNLQGANGATLMTLSASLNTTTGPAVTYSGFPSTTPVSKTTNNITITPQSVSDVYTSPQDQGFYLNSANTVTANGNFSPGNDLNTLVVTQTFSTGITVSANVDFYYENTVTAIPAGTINAITVPTSTTVSGVAILTGTPSIAVTATANNMGTYFYRSPLISYTFTNGVAKSETNLSAVNSLDISGNQFKTGTLNFSSTLTSSSLANIYSKSIVINATANNIFGTGTLTSKNINIITDGPSATLSSAIQISIPKLTSNTATVGSRIWSAPSVSNNCPELSYTGTSYSTILYDNSWDISSSSQDGFDVRNELLISNGLFTTPALSPQSAYIDYKSYTGNSSVNYSGILTTSGYRFASFCWKLNDSASSYKNLSFTINSIFTPSVNVSNLLLMNGIQLPIFYAFQDKSTTINNSTTFNSVWINANSNINPVSSGNFFNYGNTYGILGGITSAAVTLSGASATINVFVPAINPVNTSTYLYLRIAVPMDKDIRFGSVSAKIS